MAYLLSLSVAPSIHTCHPASHCSQLSALCMHMHPPPPSPSATPCPPLPPFASLPSCTPFHSHTAPLPIPPCPACTPLCAHRGTSDMLAHHSQHVSTWRLLQLHVWQGWVLLVRVTAGVAPACMVMARVEAVAVAMHMSTQQVLWWHASRRWVLW